MSVHDVENAVGAHLMNGLVGTSFELLHWRQGSAEVDFVVRSGAATWAIEVKSGATRHALPGMAAFDRRFSPALKLLVGGQGMPLVDFLSTPPQEWLRP